MTTIEAYKEPIATARRRALDEAETLNAEDRTNIRFRAIVRCTVNKTAAPDRSIKTDLTFKASSFEQAVGLTFKIKLETAAIATWFNTNQHYVLQFRDAEQTDDGAPLNRKFEGEILGKLLFVKRLGRQPGRKIGDVAQSWLEFHDEGFLLQASVDDDAQLGDHLALDYVARVVLLPAAAWVETYEDDRDRYVAGFAPRKGGPIEGQLELPFEGREDEDLEEED